MSDWSDGTPDVDSYYSAGDLDWSALASMIQGDLTPQEQSAAAGLGMNAGVGLQMPGTIGKVAAGTNINQTPPGDDKSKSPTSIWDKIAGWAQSDKGMTSIATALMGGVGMLANGKRLDRKLEIEQQAQATNAAAVAERKREFDQQMANASSIGQTNFGSAMGPGLINAPVTLTRNRLKPTPGVPA
jgi:hypothetical protein